jgi:hypothetical protein
VTWYVATEKDHSQLVYLAGGYVDRYGDRRRRRVCAGLDDVTRL